MEMQSIVVWGVLSLKNLIWGHFYAIQFELLLWAFYQITDQLVGKYIAKDGSNTQLLKIPQLSMEYKEIRAPSGSILRVWKFSNWEFLELFMKR